MAQDWSHPQDVDRLADARIEYPFRVPLGHFPRLSESLAEGASGVAEGCVSFGRERGLPVARVRVSAAPQLVCQRCLQPVAVPVQSDLNVLLVGSLERADALAPGCEAVVIEGGRVVPRDLVEEELLLGLPLVPRHEASDSCPEAFEESGPVAATQPPPEPDKQTPFAGLAQLLRRQDQ